ncbi:MAG: sigma-70 family RNA polymerase sigma factor [Bacteroidota bacterium]|nr:sigma-70 family RNA polymerase sigma factor [Bacteroidota bacterium]
MDQTRSFPVLLMEIWEKDENATRITRKELKYILKWVRRERKIKPNVHDDDLIQEALIRFYNKKKLPDLDTKAKTYLMGIIRRIIKEERRLNIEIPTADFLTSGYGIVENLIVLFEKDESNALLQEMVIQLPKKCQELIYMMYYKGFTTNEICEKLGYASIEIVHKKRFLCIKVLRGNMKGNKECCLNFDL